LTFEDLRGGCGKVGLPLRLVVDDVVEHELAVLVEKGGLEPHHLVPYCCDIVEKKKNAHVDSDQRREIEENKRRKDKPGVEGRGGITTRK
jgi:hypothetical protein